MRILFLDCSAGISGDMTVGALCDLGVNPSTFEWELSKLDLGDFHMHFERGLRQHVEGVKFGIHEGSTHTHDQDEDELAEHAHEHGGHEHAGHDDEHQHEHAHAGHGHANEHDAPGHEHEHADEHHEHEHHQHEHEPGRAYAEIRALLENSDLSDYVKQHALSIFHRIAVAEAKIHGQAVETVGFHEVGALDSIADIVCACVGFEELGVEKIYCGPLADGHGWSESAHGRFAIPAMATLEILRGIPLGQIDEPFEFITPTGAAIIREFAESREVMPRLVVEKIGYGLGSRDLASRPNVLRAILGEVPAESQEQAATAAEPAADSAYETDTVTQLETNLDDLSPQMVGALIERLLTAGALDAFLTPAQMKKNRPGVLLTVLCRPQDTDPLASIIFRESTAFGVRLTDKRRLKLARRLETVATAHGDVTVKLGLDRAGQLLQVAPEFDSCRAVAERTGTPLRAVHQAAIESFRLQAE